VQQVTLSFQAGPEDWNISTHVLVEDQTLSRFSVPTIS